MDYTVWSKEHLEQHVVSLADDSRVSLWCTAPSEKPLLVFVHGIGGDRAGLVPLAAELEPFFRIALVELPGHGGSSRIPLPNVSSLQGWFQAVLARIEEEIAPVAAICAHSFGCSAVLGKEVLARKKVILMNPVPTPSGMYATYARAIMDSAYFWAHIYNWRPLALLRGRVLVKIRTHDAIRRVHWVSRWSVATPDQVVYQAGLVDIILDKATYRGIGGESVALVICGMFDTTAHERDSLDMEAVFGGSRIVFLRGGHILPIEAPVRVASLVRESMVK